MEQDKITVIRQNYLDTYEATFIESNSNFYLKTITKNGELVYDFDNEIDNYFNTTEDRVEFMRQLRKINTKNFSANYELTSAFYNTNMIKEL